MYICLVLSNDSWGRQVKNLRPTLAKLILILQVAGQQFTNTVGEVDIDPPGGNSKFTTNIGLVHIDSPGSVK